MTAAVTTGPRLAVSAAIFREGKILLVRRARAPARGVYTLPGGRVEFGETLIEALTREIAEETQLTIEIGGLAGWREALPAQAGGGHFVILPFAARWISGEPVLNDELDDAQWRVPGTLSDLRLTQGLEEIITAAARMVG
jgi:ADP-ribose pyrophosphatase YjhB (NUDIX family)